MLTGNGIYKSYGEHRILENVNIEVAPGRFTFLIGPSGCGKTTLIKCLSLVEKPDKGGIHIDDKHFIFPGENGHKPWPEVTIVFQQQFLWPHLTLKDNILFPIEDKPDKEDLFNEMVELFDMSGYINRYPNEASIGQRQRVAIARALVLKPKYILLDEITTALDIEQTNILFSHLTELSSRGIGMLLVTHYFDFARKLLAKDRGDSIAFMIDGRIEETGGLELLHKPKSARIKRFLNSLEI